MVASFLYGRRDHGISHSLLDGTVCGKDDSKTKQNGSLWNQVIVCQRVVFLEVHSDPCLCCQCNSWDRDSPRCPFNFELRRFDGHQTITPDSETTDPL